ncbi:MAG: hypothetical protein PVH61_42675 [Candidatus Aminicenantes bacterium]|jgi:hypothetical protein
MTRKIEIAVENRLTALKRDINVYHLSTRSAHIISYNSSITLSLGPPGSSDYMQVSAAGGPGHLWKHCLIRLPSWADFEFTSNGNVTFTHCHNSHGILLKIPPGPPTWELKITGSPALSPGNQSLTTADYISISDDE